MGESQRVRLTVHDAVARITFCAPERRNAQDLLWLREFGEAVDGCAEAGPRAILIDAEGKAFTAGGDLRHLGEHLDDLESALGEMVRPFHAAIEQLVGLEAPIVVALQGAVAGGGTGLVWIADHVLAVPTAKIIPGFPAIATSGDGGGSWWLPRLVGPRRAQQLLMGGVELGAEEALEWGLVTELVVAAELEERSLARARELAAGPTAAYGLVRRLVRESFGRSYGEQLVAEAEAMLACGRSADTREGIASMLERRPPEFSGR